MFKVYWLILLTFLTCGSICAQVSPKERSKLNYRLVGFSSPVNASKQNQTIEIAQGWYNSENTFAQHIVVTKSGANKIVAEVPAFGADYTWRISGRKEFYHFSTLACQDADTNVSRVRIIKNTGKYGNNYFFLDANKAMYDLNGSLLWFLPQIPGMGGALRDMKLTDAGTITFLADNGAYEVNYEGEILWRAPDNGAVNGDTTEDYHHELVRLKNGHYMVMGNERVLFVRPSATDTVPHYVKFDQQLPAGNPGIYQQTVLGTLIEYDHAGKVVWRWKSSDYFKGSITRYLKDADNGQGVSVDLHENAFYFDEARRNIYISLRNINLLVKLSYPDGKVIAEYCGQRSTSGRDKALFCGQHSCKVSKKGLLYLMNNHVCGAGLMPEVSMFTEPATGSGDLKKVWSFDCSLEGIDTTGRSRTNFISGGNVVELDDGALFVSLPGMFGKAFIVGQDKNVQWSAVAERHNIADNRWLAFPLYRANMVADRTAVEKLIFGD